MFKSFISVTGLCLILFVSNAYAIDQFGSSPISPINPTGMPDTPQGQGLPSRQRDTKPPISNEAVNTANKEITARLDNLLSGVNQTREPNLTDLAQISDTLKKNMQNLQKTDARGQSNLQLLNAWMSYFSGDTKRAKLAANSAYKTNPKNKDAQSTYIMMCIANNDIKAAKTTITAIRKNAAKAATTATRGEQQNVSSASAAIEAPVVLDFDVNSVKVELLDKSIGFSEVSCLNGTLLPYKEGKILLMLLWANKAIGTEQTQSVYGARSSQKLSPIESFELLFAKDFANGNMGFLGLNLDAASENNAVMETLMKNAWPWPQAMAQDPRNSSLASFVSLKTDKPSLAISGADGAVKYAGAFSNPMLWIMARQVERSPEMSMPEKAKKVEEVNTPAAAAAKTIKEANSPAITKQPNAAPKPKAQKSEEERLNPAATDLYQFAVSQKSMAHIVGYGKMIDACRQILREYPDAPEAEKARQLLREVPDNKKQQFHITNEEMGL